jgi:hypothetical protein
MIFRDEYRLQRIIGALHAGIIMTGSLMLGVTLKVRGYPDEFADIPLLMLFVRNWGFTLILIPLAWVVYTIWSERDDTGSFSKRWTLISGIGLGLILIWFHSALVLQAGSSLLVADGPTQ